MHMHAYACMHACMHPCMQRHACMHPCIHLSSLATVMNVGGGTCDPGNFLAGNCAQQCHCGDTIHNPQLWNFPNSCMHACMHAYACMHACTKRTLPQLRARSCAPPPRPRPPVDASQHHHTKKQHQNTGQKHTTRHHPTTTTASNY